MNVLTVFALCMVDAVQSQTDISCEPKFEYEYGVLTKLAELTMENTNLKDLLTKQDLVVNMLSNKLEEAIETIDNLNETITVLESQHTGGGTTYIRWGRTTCTNNGAEVVYDGYAAGAHYTHGGGAADYLCLPKDPVWGQYNDALQNKGLLYGAEYEIGGQYQDHEVPCVVCRIPRTSVRMIPGRNICYPGWTLEYSGYLASGYYSHAKSSEHVCLDADLETIDKHNNNNGVLFYYVEGRCGSLPCPPYVDGRELTCAVCSYNPQADTKLFPSN